MELVEKNIKGISFFKEKTIKYFKKYFRIVLIDVLVYRISSPTHFLTAKRYTIEKQKISINKIKYYIEENNKIIHSSCLFMSLHILKLIHKKGPAIGDCFTNNEHRGKSIYPFVINSIANEIISENGSSEIFILVDSNNFNSIRGIEKAGYVLHSKIVTKRFLFFYFKTKVINFNL
ncbi:hypothetical protein [Flavobacterium granuli]|uniref:N-acetyltransferase domain-containing protein n=1 Tax=Flavobacterium granuli TaxID=280093 RepID=A0ABU1S605_9FLAO|nr:hypothetical protein [Flavobacterium granuli]MDR6846433.1 hypothetical protein [Flavobacterium granuli]